MDGSGSVGAFGGTACWRCRVGGNAARRAADESRCLFRANVEVTSVAVALYALNRIKPLF